MAVSKRLRYEILRRDSNTCRYCGAKAPDVPLRIDHVTPVALGGSDDPSNLVTSCEPCNSGKTSSTPDAALVAGVSDDALRWAEAMKQAAENLRAQEGPKLAYRSAFEAAWKDWDVQRDGKAVSHELPADWKASLERFRQAGLPETIWADIVDTAMANKLVKEDNLFRYCCGIAWNKVGELQDAARRITGAAPAEVIPIDPVVQAAVDVWVSEHVGEVDSAEREAFQASAIAARKREDAHRIVQAGQYAAWYGESNAGKALAQLDREDVLQAWQFAWLTKTGEWPGDDRTETVRTKCDALLAADVHVSRVVRAAIYAGSRRSVRLYFGLSETELAEIKESDFIAKAAEVWAEAFRASADRGPTQPELSAFFASLRRIGADDEGFWLVDIYQAAASAGAYQDPDMSTCLPRHLSVFEAAAAPLSAA